MVSFAFILIRTSSIEEDIFYKRVIHFMKLVIILAICLALFSAGCMEKEDSGGAKDSAVGASEPVEHADTDRIIVTITSPDAGQIIKGDEDISFEGSAKGGEGDLSYEWSSSIDGKLSASRSFKQNPAELEKGGHIIILKAMDESGKSGQGSVQVEVM
jgi:hypothetical protein